MNHINRILVTISVLVLSPIFLFADSFIGDCDFFSGGIYYAFTGANTVGVARKNLYGGDYSSSVVVIPETVNYGGYQYKVTSIVERAFYRCESLKCVVIPASITKIGDYAIDTNDVALVMLGDKVEFEYRTSPGKLYVLDPNNFELKNGSNTNRITINRLCYISSTFPYSGKPLDNENVNVSLNDELSSYFTISSFSLSDNEKYDAGSYYGKVNLNFFTGISRFSGNTSFKYTITKRALDVVADNVSREYGLENPNFTISNITGFVNGEDTFSSNTIIELNCEATTKSHVGDYQLSATIESKNYYLNSIKGNLSVTKAPLIVYAPIISRQYGDENPQILLTYDGLRNEESSPLMNNEIKVSTSATKESSVGEYIIMLSGGEAKNYELTRTVGTLTVTKAPLSIKALDCEREYGNENEFTFAYTGFKNGEDNSVLIEQPIMQTNATASSDIGIYDLTPANAQASNYQITYIKGQLSILPAPLTVSVGSYERYYGDENPQFEINYSGFKLNQTPDILTPAPVATTNATRSSNVGSYTINLSGGNSKNYQISYNSGNLTINKAPLIITPEETSKEYGEPNPTIALTYNGLKNGESEPTFTTPVSIQVAATKYSSVGEYPINLSGGVAKNYEVSLQSGSLTIYKAPLTIKSNDVNTVYGEQPTYTYSYSGFKNADDESDLITLPRTVTTATIESTVGTYTITPTNAKSDNYKFHYNSGILTINEASLIVKAPSVTREYGEANPQIAFSYIGFRNGDSEANFTELPQIELPDIRSNAGMYTIIANGGIIPNYTLDYRSGSLIINKATLLVGVENESRLYGDENPIFQINYSGFKNEDNEECLTSIPTTTTVDKLAEVGKYPIEISGGEAVNYSLSYQNGELAVNKAPLTITANNISKIYGEENPNLTFDITGFRNEDTVSCLISQPQLYCKATTSSPVGTYSISVSGAEAKNYEIEHIPGQLEIQKADYNFYWNQSIFVVRENERIPIEMIYENLDGILPVFSHYNSELIEIEYKDNNYFVKGLKPGTTSLTVSLPETANYNKSLELTEMFKVEVQSGLENVIIDSENGVYYVYNVSGVLMCITEDPEDLNQMAPGLYIINGKKYLIR